MNRRDLRRDFCGFVLPLAILAASGAPLAAREGRRADPGRLDARLRAAANGGARAPQRVIIRVRPGTRPALKRALAGHGDRILAEHESLNAVTALIHAADLAELSKHLDTVSISEDAIVRADGLLGGLLGIVGGLVKVVGSVLLPNGADTSGNAVPPAVLRSTLGLSGE